MRVLHLPLNISSIPSHTVRGLRQVGVDARGLVFGNARTQSPEGLRVIHTDFRRYSVRWLWSKLYWAGRFIESIRWADVIHWYFGAPALPWGLDLAIIKCLKKPGIAEWMGSDIRIPEVEFSENPYYTAALHNGYEYYGMESLEKSRQRQKRFAAAGFASGAAIGMLQYIQRDITLHPYVLSQRIVTSDYSPVYPSASVTRPIIVHSPTAPVAKGTAAVLKAVEQLRPQCRFEFRLIQGVERAQALKLVQEADIYLDQFVLGDRGMAALEAMALGKPVVCYIKPSLAAQYPSDLPIVNATPDNLAEVLKELLEDSHLRHELGRRGRAYVEQYHDALKVASHLKSIYQELGYQGT